MKSPNADRVTSLEQAAAGHGNVVRLSEANLAGLSAAQRRAQVRAGRWEDVPYRGVVTGKPDDETPYLRALLSVGQGAAIGGVSALRLAGLEGWEERRIHTWVRKSCSKRKVVDGVHVHESRRWTADDVLTVGVPRARANVAAVQAALWAVSVRQAATVLAMSVQQRIVPAGELVTTFDRVLRHPFRTPLRLVLADIADGAHSINELDFARLCRVHGLPEPSRQVPRRTAQGRIYLDACWERYGIRVEVNGAGHGFLTQAMSDEIRGMHAQIDGEACVTVSILTLRVDPQPFLAALARLLRSRGWPG